MEPGVPVKISPEEIKRNSPHRTPTPVLTRAPFSQSFSLPVLTGETMNIRKEAMVRTYL
jgi:hypothetical protein